MRDSIQKHKKEKRKKHKAISAGFCIGFLAKSEEYRPFEQYNNGFTTKFDAKDRRSSIPR
jgi:hypothetical protein